MSMGLLELAELMNAAVGMFLTATKKMYRIYYDEMARQQPLIYVGDDVLMDCPQHAAFASKSVEGSVRKKYVRLIRGMHGLHRIKEVGSHTIFNNADGIQDIEAVDRVSSNQNSTEDEKQETGTKNCDKRLQKLHRPQIRKHQTMSQQQNQGPGLHG